MWSDITISAVYTPPRVHTNWPFLALAEVDQCSRVAPTAIIVVKKKQYHHHKPCSQGRGTDDNISDILKSMREEMKSFLQRISNIEKGQAATMQSTADKIAEKSTTENVVGQSSQDVTSVLPPPREEQSAFPGEIEAPDANSGWANHNVDKLPDYNEHIF